MYIYIYMYTHVYMYMCVYIYIYIYICLLKALRSHTDACGFETPYSEASAHPYQHLVFIHYITLLALSPRIHSDRARPLAA